MARLGRGVLGCTVLGRTGLGCKVLVCTVLTRTILRCTALWRDVQFRLVLWGHALWGIVLRYGALGSIAVISGAVLAETYSPATENQPKIEQQTCSKLLSHQFKKLNSSDEIDLCAQFRGKVLLVVNTASQCGYTPQFEQLEALHQRYRQQGLSIIGFPSNDFRQDRGSEADSAKVCYLDYGVTFTMLERSHVTGEQANPVFRQLANDAGVAPSWNFFKYIVDRNGKAVAVFSSRTTPDDPLIVATIEKLL
ncbi:glutathione peroxidase [Photobacterium ganghwense]|nr:glutathione peroxidase [Photobacterium ganghwense]